MAPPYPPPPQPSISPQTHPNLIAAPPARPQHKLQLARGIEVLERSSHPLRHRLLALAHPHTGVVVLLVGLVLAVRVADLAADVVLLAEHVVPDTFRVGVLQIGVEVDFDDAVGDGVGVVLLRRSRPAVEDEEDGFLVFRALLLLHVLLVLLQQFRAELDVARLVDAVDVAEAGRDGEVGADGAKGLVDLVNVLGLGVQAVVVHVFVVHAVFLAACDADLHLQPLLHRCGALEVGCGRFDVPVNRFLRQVDHVGGEERLAVFLVPRLVRVEHAVKPWQELLGAVIGVEDYWDAVGWSDCADVVGGRHGSGDGGGLVLVVDALAAEVGSATLGELQDDGSLCILCGFESGDDGGRGGDVDGGDGVVVLLGVLEELCSMLSGICV